MRGGARVVGCEGVGGRARAKSKAGVRGVCLRRRWRRLYVDALDANSTLVRGFVGFELGSVGFELVSGLTLVLSDL